MRMLAEKMRRQIMKLQQTLVELNRSAAVVRSTSVVALSELVPRRTLPLLRSAAAPGTGRSGMPGA